MLYDSSFSFNFQFLQEGRKRVAIGKLGKDGGGRENGNEAWTIRSILRVISYNICISGVSILFFSFFLFLTVPIGKCVFLMIRYLLVDGAGGSKYKGRFVIKICLSLDRRNNASMSHQNAFRFLFFFPELLVKLIIRLFVRLFIALSMIR